MQSPPPVPGHARFARWSPALVLALAACNPTVPEATGGTDVAPTAFGRGVVTVNTDYQSTNVSLVGLDGRRLSESFISSASKLSSDVFAPSMPVSGDEVVLLDRSSAIVSWVNVRTAAIRAQLHVDDERATNPWDYVPVAPGKAYVTRYDAAGGKDATNGDVVIVDVEGAALGAPIDVAAAVGLGAGFGVHPARGVVHGDRAYATVVVHTPDYEYGTSYVIAIDVQTDAIVAVQPLDQLHDCIGIALSPSGEELAIACSGDLLAGAPSTQAGAGLVLLARADLSEKKRFAPTLLGQGPPGFFLAYAAEHAVLMSTLGNADDRFDDTAITVDTTSGDVREVYRAAPVQIGGVLCPARIDGKSDGATASPACFVTDAEKGVLVRFPVENGLLGDPVRLLVDETVGLPPRYLGQF